MIRRFGEFLAMTWPIVLLIGVLALAGCTTTPDGRRVLSPAARGAGAAVLEDVLACGLPLVAGALAGEPDYLAASRCHLERVGERLGGLADRHPDASAEHGELVLRTAELAEGEADEDLVKATAHECDRVARAKLRGSR